MNDLSDIEGLFVGQLSPDELAMFRDACERGVAYEAYESAAGFMGLAKVKMIAPTTPARKEPSDG